jgi:hypothetical protein
MDLLQTSLQQATTVAPEDALGVMQNAIQHVSCIAPDTQVSDLSAELLATAQDLMNERTERKRLQDRLDARDRVANEVATRNIAAHEGLDKSDL